jgi:TRAP-type C4-dicarboxylate transport system permease small subunit
MGVVRICRRCESKSLKRYLFSSLPRNFRKGCAAFLFTECLFWGFTSGVANTSELAIDALLDLVSLRVRRYLVKVIATTSQ